MSSQNKLSIIQLDCVRGEKVLFRSLSSSVESGQCLHVTGANGSGKTTLLRMMCGLNQPEAGRIEWNGATINANPTYADSCAYIGHKDGLKDELTAVENLRFQQRLDSSLDEDKLDRCLQTMQILRCADLPALKLSFGQRRRLAFAKLVLRSYDLWILDEPFTGIDIEGRSLIEGLCQQYMDNGGIIVLTHHQGLEATALGPYLAPLELA